MKKILSFLLVFVLIVSAVPLGAFDFSVSAATSGITGDCTWSISGTTLTISGNGLMENYTSSDDAPWFYNTITRVTIKNGVTSIGDKAFEGSDIKYVTIPDSVKSIGSSAFNNCHNLISVTIPNSVLEIRAEAFFACESLTSIVIPDSVTTIANDAFSCCENLTNVTLGNGITTIKTGTFSCCWNLTNVNFSNNITTIEMWAFEDCAIKELVFPDSLTTLEYRAFASCTNLETVKFGANITDIKSSAFEDCTNLENITITDKEIFIGQDAFKNTAYYNNNSNWVDGVLYINTHLIKAKSTISGHYNVKNGTKNIAYEAFRDCTNLVEITLPNSITNICEAAFYNCSALKKINIFANLKKISSYTFQFCYDIENITIPNNVSKIERQAFYGCAKLKSVIMPKNVKFIEDCAFIDCENLTDIWYLGNREEKNSIVINEGNSELENANWHYDSCYIGALHSEQTKIENRIYPSCTENGSYDEIIYCTVCDDELSRETVIVPALGHNWEIVPDDIFIPENPTYHDECSICGERGFGYYTECDLYGHNVYNYVINPTCTKDGYIIFSCSRYRCGYEYTEYPDYLKATGHTFGEVTVIEPTYTSEGYKSHKCTECGEVEDFDYVPALRYAIGDVYGDGLINNRDLAVLMQYLNGWDVEIIDYAADVNGDNVVNNRDYALLMQYCNGWDVELK